MLTLALLAFALSASAAERKTIDFDYVSELAETLAQDSYRQLERPLPDFFKSLGYDQYRDIHFDPDRALWQSENRPFSLQLMHRGYLFTDPVILHEYTETHVQEIPYVREMFSFGQLDIERYPSNGASYAGWRIHHPLNRDDYYDEVISFLGASYFRALGRGNHYGLSARGLLIPHAEEEPEEFPRFTHFWIRKPSEDAETLTVLALLDSESISGAYAFRIKPGDPTEVRVRVRLFARKELQAIGIAPLTSMFYYGKQTQPKPVDFRPQVHDSDGLFIHREDGSAIWRPLNVGPQLREQSYYGNEIQAFGLLQRDRDYGNYLDAEAQYAQRPSLMVIPNDPFPAGDIVLRELPPSGEFEDNIVAYYQPSAAILPGTAIEFNYTLYWGFLEDPHHALAKVTQTRHGRDIRYQKDEIFLVEFAAPEGGIPNTITPQIKIPEGTEIRDTAIHTNPGTDLVHLRIKLQIEPEAESLLNIEATLYDNEEPYSETWQYQWTPLP